MSLINSSYFIGSINIPNTGTLQIEEAIEAIIAEREEKMLIDFFGYELFKIFTTGLSATVIEQKYLDIIFGCEYQSRCSGRLTKWKGLVANNAMLPAIDNSVQSFFFKVGTTNAPADGSNQYVNQSLLNRKYVVYQRGFGPLWDGLDITVNNDGFTFNNGVLFAQDDVFYIQFTDTRNGAVFSQVNNPNVTVDDYYFVVGSNVLLPTGATAPASNVSEYIDTYLLNKSFRVIQRGFGILHIGIDYEIINTGGIRLLNGSVFSADDIYDVQIKQSLLVANNNKYPTSPIADYIYYWYVRNIVTQTAIGEVQTKSENATLAPPAMKMKMAYNRFIDEFKCLEDMLLSRAADYPTFENNCRCRSRLLVKINPLNI